ncbi:MAG TPA: phosphatase PAP2 family protein [Lacipirellulaceae bacterium]|nr:phosphatase PAP2 family protein [Lacipirellulaceae bacterium]
MLKHLFIRIHPGDRTLLALLTLANLVCLIRLPVVGGPLIPIALALLGLFVGLIIAIVVLTRWENRRWVPFVRAVVTVTIVFSLYTALGKLGVVAMPYLADAALSHADNWLLGFDPSLAIQTYQTHVRIEFFSFFYASFIPYIYLSLFLGCIGKPPLERDQYLTGWIFTYAISYLGYIFLPAHGPGVFQADQYQVALGGGFFYRLVVLGNEATGGLQGVFPSLHVGCSVYLCVSDLRKNLLRGLTYLPLVVLIYVATIFLRYHYIVDLIAGTIIPIVCIYLGEWAVNRWVRTRWAAGLAALPGSDGDVVPSGASFGTVGRAPLLPSH